MMVGRELTRLENEFPELEIEKVDILAAPGRALKAGVRMIPTLLAGEDRLSGLFLSSGKIRDFIIRHYSESDPA